MQDILWALAIINVAYILFALKKSQKTQSKSLADSVRVLDVPEDMLSVKPVAKRVSIKEQDTKTPANWWENKIQDRQHRSTRRKNFEPEQMLLSDIDETLN
jgi:hypothetical protein